MVAALRDPVTSTRNLKDRGRFEKKEKKKKKKNWQGFHPTAALGNIFLRINLLVYKHLD